MKPWQGRYAWCTAGTPAEWTSCGLQLAAVYNSGSPALVWVLAVLACLPALPCCFVWGSSRDIVWGLRPILLCVPLLNEIWSLLCNSSPPSALLSVNCIADGGSGVFLSDDRAHLMKHAGKCCMFHCEITAECSSSIEFWHLYRHGH